MSQRSYLVGGQNQNVPKKQFSSKKKYSPKKCIIFETFRSHLDYHIWWGVKTKMFTKKNVHLKKMNGILKVCANFLKNNFDPKIPKFV